MRKFDYNISISKLMDWTHRVNLTYKRMYGSTNETSLVSTQMYLLLSDEYCCTENMKRMQYAPHITSALPLALK